MSPALPMLAQGLVTERRQSSGLVSPISRAPALTPYPLCPSALFLKPKPMRYLYPIYFAIPVLALILFGSSGATGHPVVPSTAIMAYFKNINLASRAIYDSDFAGASAHYDEAFKFKAAPFYLDLKNAIIVNSKCGFYAKNNALLKIMLQQKNVNVSKLFEEFPVYLLDPGNLETIRKVQAQPSKSGFDPMLYKAVLQLFEEGQAIGGFEQLEQIRDEKERSRLLKQAYQARDSLNNVNALKFINFLLADVVVQSGDFLGCIFCV